MKLGIWISAFRLRTLPLALSCIALGGFMAVFYDVFRWNVFLLTNWVAILLQVLSNLANDYGDSKHGADNLNRKGPARAVQAGLISGSAMKKALVIMVILTFVSGIALLLVSFGWGTNFLIFLGLGLLSIAAAIAYTNGKRPYGYSGLGDISVMIFFGIIGVLGSLYLYQQQVHLPDIFPALSCGFFATAVLNLNNTRDINSDKLAGKNTIPVRLGRTNAVYYHWALLLSGFVCALIFAIIYFHHIYQYLFLLALPLFIINARAVYVYKDEIQLDPYLKQLVLSTLVFVLLFGSGLILY